MPVSSATGETIVREARIVEPRSPWRPFPLPCKGQLDSAASIRRLGGFHLEAEGAAHQKLTLLATVRFWVNTRAG